MLDPVTANFLGDNLRCWMQIQVTFKAISKLQCHFMEIKILAYLYKYFLQVGKGPYASEVSGIVKIGQTMTMVMGIKVGDIACENKRVHCVMFRMMRTSLTCW